MLDTVRTRLLTPAAFNGLLVATLSVCVVNDVLFHIGLLLTLLFLALLPKCGSLSKAHWLVFWLMMQYPLYLILRRVMDWGITIDFWENLIRWSLMSALILWLPLKQRVPALSVFVLAAAAAMVVSGSVAVYQVEFAGIRRAGGTENPLNFAMFNALFSAFVLYALLQPGLFKPWTRVLLAFVFPMGLVAIVYSGSRGPLLTYFAVILLVLLITYRHAIFTRVGLALCACAVVAAGTGAWWIGNETGLIDKTQRDFEVYLNTGRLTSSGARIEMWKFSIDTFLQFPIFGADTEYRLLQEQGGKFIAFNPGIRQYAHSHNEILSALSQRGLLGLASLAVIWLIPFFLYRQYKPTILTGSYRRHAFNLLSLLSAGWFISGMTQVHTHHVSGMMLLPLLITLTVCMSLSDADALKDQRNTRPKG